MFMMLAFLPLGGAAGFFLFFFFTFSYSFVVSFHGNRLNSHEGWGCHAGAVVSNDASHTWDHDSGLCLDSMWGREVFFGYSSFPP